MNHTRSFVRLILFFLFVLVAGRAGSLQAQEPVVNAVLFYSPTCSHCHYVISEVLPPLFDEHGEQLQMIGIDISQPKGQAIYQAAISQYNISEGRRGVPTLLVADRVLVGSGEIPDQFPGLINDYLSNGGAPWPELAGLREVLIANGLVADEAAAAPEATADTETLVAATNPETMAAATSSTMAQRFMLDPLANTLAVIVLLGLLGVTIYGALRLWQAWQVAGTFPLPVLTGWQSWAVAILAVIGIGISAYMAFVETTETLAICGPVGDCNTVQQSAYARLFGVLPIGVLGLFGYVAILLAWAGLQWGKGSLRRFAGVALVIMAVAGTLFSIYLTFLEPFVIGASCAWCLSSAIAMGAILYLVARSLPLELPKKGRTRPARARA